MNLELVFKTSQTKGESKHPKCEGYVTYSPNGNDFSCGYNTILQCEECKYGLGRKDPEAKCNQL